MFLFWWTTGASAFSGVCVGVAILGLLWACVRRSGYSAQASPESGTKERETLRLLHTWGAKPRIQTMIQDAVWAGLLPEHLLETRLAAVFETATSTHLSVLDDEDQATAKLYVQKAAQAADEAWQQTVSGLQGPGATSSASQEEDGDDMDFSAPRKSRVSAPQLQSQLSRLTDRTRLKRLKNTLLSTGAWQQVTRIEDLCHTQVSHKWLYHQDACAGSVLTPHDYITNVQKRLGNRIWVGGGSFLDPRLEHGETCSIAEATRGHHACVHAVVCGLKLADPGITTEPTGLAASQSRPTDIFTTAAVPGRSAALCRSAGGI